MLKTQKLIEDSDERLLEILKTPITAQISSSAGSEQLRQHLCAKGLLDHRSSQRMILLTKWIAFLTIVLTILTALLVYKELAHY